MQIKAFEDLLQKYQDYDMSPGAEPFENIMTKFNQPWTKYYFILDGEEVVGCTSSNQSYGATKSIVCIFKRRKDQ